MRVRSSLRQVRWFVRNEQRQHSAAGFFGYSHFFQKMMQPSLRFFSPWLRPAIKIVMGEETLQGHPVSDLDLAKSSPSSRASPRL